MNSTPTPNGQWEEAGSYEIRIKGRLEPRWAAWFDGLSLSQDDDGSTVVEGTVVDQAALHGLLAKVRDVGLPLISVTRLPPQLDLPDEPS
jgi:hypothetical protein